MKIPYNKIIKTLVRLKQYHNNFCDISTVVLYFSMFPVHKSSHFCHKLLHDFL